MPVTSPTAPGFLVGRVAHLLRVRMADLIKQRGFSISAEECVVLSMIVQSDRPLRVGELAGMASRDPTTLKRQLDGLAKNDLVFRTADEKDGRAVVVRPTVAGREVITELSSPFDDLCEITMANISSDELEVLQRGLQLMLQNLNARHH